MKKILLAIFVMLIVFLASAWIYLARAYPTTAPLKSSVYFLYSLLSPHKKMTKDVLGFLPYWHLDDIPYIRHDLVTDVNYFSLFADKNGEIVKSPGGETNPGWRDWNSQRIKDLIAKTQILGGKFSVTIAAQDNDTIESILKNRQAQEKLIANISNMAEERKINGINIDFEYQNSCTSDEEEPDAKKRKSSPSTGG